MRSFPEKIQDDHTTSLPHLTLLYWAAVFFVIAIIAAVFGFTGIAAAAAGIAKILFFIFLVFFVVTSLAGVMRRGPKL